MPLQRLWLSYRLWLYFRTIRTRLHLRYFTTVRVTAAVYRGFDLLKQILTHRYWAGIRNCTQAFALAVSIVFVKQSLAPCYCDLLLLVTGMASSEHTPLICRFPWTGFSQHAVAFSATPPVAVLGMDMKDPYELPFHGLLESAELCIRRAILAFTCFSSLQDSTGFSS